MLADNPVKVTVHDLVKRTVTIHYAKDYKYIPVLRNPDSN